MDSQTDIFALKGTKQLVVGGSRGLGLKLSLHLKEVGADVLSIGRSKAPQSKDADGVYKSCDMNDLDYLHLTVKSFLENKTLSGVCMVAGVSYTPIDITSPQERFSKSIQANLTSHFLCINLLKEFLGDGASVVFYSSINAQLGFPGNPGYVASKAGLSGLTRALATDWASDGVRVNSLQLGYFRTEMTKDSYQDVEKFRQRSARSLMGRWGTDEEALGPTQFLLSKASSFMTGQALSVDGGWTVKGL